MSQEYDDLGQNMRHYSDLRFKRLTVFLFASGGLLGAHFAGPSEGTASVAIPVLGLLLTAAFWVMVNRVGRYYWHFRRRAAELEADLGYQQYSTLPAQAGVTDRSLAILFLGFVLTWALLLGSNALQNLFGA